MDEEIKEKSMDVVTLYKMANHCIRKPEERLKHRMRPTR